MNYCKYNLEEKTASITDSSKGICNATALRLAEEGANGIVNYLNTACALKFEEGPLINSINMLLEKI